MAPKHGDAVTQTAASPFTITGAANAAGTRVTLTVAGSGDKMFKGFLIAARAPSDVNSETGTNLGQFFPENGMAQTLKCGSTAVSSKKES